MVAWLAPLVVGLTGVLLLVAGLLGRHYKIVCRLRAVPEEVTPAPDEFVLFDTRAFMVLPRLEGTTDDASQC